MTSPVPSLHNLSLSGMATISALGEEPDSAEGVRVRIASAWHSSNFDLGPLKTTTTKGGNAGRMIDFAEANVATEQRLFAIDTGHGSQVSINISIPSLRCKDLRLDLSEWDVPYSADEEEGEEEGEDLKAFYYMIYEGDHSFGEYEVQINVTIFVDMSKHVEAFKAVQSLEALKDLCYIIPGQVHSIEVACRYWARVKKDSTKRSAGSSSGASSDKRLKL